MKTKLKYGDIVLYKDSVGVVRNPGLTQISVSVQWVHNQQLHSYYIPKYLANRLEVLPKDVGMDLIRLYDKEVYLG